MCQLNRKNSWSWSGGETLWASHTDVLLILPAPPLPCLTLSHRHALWLFKSSFHGDSILKFSRSRTRIIFYLLLLLRGNLGKGSLLQIKRGVRGEEGRHSSLSSLDWIRWSCWNSSFPASLPHRQPSPSFFGVLGHLFLTRLCFDEDMGEGKGYGTKRHLELMDEYGLNDLYRYSFKPCKDRQLRLFWIHLGIGVFYGNNVLDEQRTADLVFFMLFRELSENPKCD